MSNKYDLSDLGATIASPTQNKNQKQYDLSDLGGNLVNPTSDPSSLADLGGTPMIPETDTAEPFVRDIVEPAKRSIVEIGKGMLRGFQGIVSGTGGLMDVLGQNLFVTEDKAKEIISAGVIKDADIKRRNIVAKKLSEWGTTAKDFWDNASQKGVAAPDPKIFSGTFMQNPSWTRGITTVAGAIPSLAAAHIASMATGNPGVGLAYLGMLEGEPIFAGARAAGVPLEKANKLFAASAIGTSILENMPLGRFFRGGEGKVAKDIFVGAVQEGTEEIAQQFLNNFIEKVGFNKTKDLFEGMVESFLGGAGSGGVLGGLTSGRGYKLDQDIQDSIDSGANPREIETMLRLVESQIVSAAQNIEKTISENKSAPATSVENPPTTPGKGIVIDKATGKPLEINAEAVNPKQVGGGEAVETHVSEEVNNLDEIKPETILERKSEGERRLIKKTKAGQWVTQWYIPGEEGGDWVPVATEDIPTIKNGGWHEQKLQLPPTETPPITKEAPNDTQNVQGVQGSEQIGEEPVKTKPIESSGGEEIKPSRILQTQGEIDSAPTQAPLRPEPVEQVSASPTRPPSGWDSDPGAMPGEAGLTHKNGAVIERIDDKGNVLYEGVDNSGNSLGLYPEVDQAMSAVETYGMPSPNNLVQAEEELGKTAVDDLDFMHSGPTLFPQSQKKIINDTIKESFSFSDPEIAARIANAEKGVMSPTVIQRIKQAVSNFVHRLTRVYPTLPNDPKYAELRNTLSKQSVAKQNAQDRTIRAIDAITAGFGPQKMRLFSLKVILDDLTREVDAGRPIPFYSKAEGGEIVTNKETLQSDYKKINEVVESNPDIKVAVEKRSKLWDAITGELVKYGILTEDKVKSNYYRHQVLEYARAKATYGTGRKLKTPRPGYAKRRGGSPLDINASYMEAEFEVMAQALHDIETAKNIKAIEDSNLNIVNKLKQKAKQKSKDTGEKVDWHDLIPDGYTTWQPREGNIFFLANSVPQKIINQVLDGFDIGITEEDIKKVLAVGAKRKEFVLPIEVADTLDNLYEVKDSNFIRIVAQRITTSWKRWVLMNPRRFIKYNWQNFLGDFDAVIAGNPGLLKKFFKANGELLDVFYKGKPMPQTLREFVERGGITSGLTVQELPELRKLEIFQRLLSQGEARKQELNYWRKYWSSIGTFTMYRESIFRYAAYLYYRDLFVSRKKVNYGASIKEEIDALNNPLDKAAKVATELLGDYANISAFGRDMRETIVPFYSWLEINVKRYPRLVRNNFNEGWQAGIRTSAVLAGVKGGAFLARWMLRAVALTATMALYNHTFFSDEEEELSEYDRNRMHIILGRDKYGNIRILRGQGAFADLLEWFGLDASPTLWKEYFDGKASLVDLFGNIPGTDFPAFGLNPFKGKLGIHPAVQKIIRGINPLYKLTFETLTGKSLPVFDDQSWRVEDKTRNILKALSLENEYDALMKEPSRGYARSIIESFITVQDPSENAYRYIQGQKYKFLETVKGRGGSGDYYSPRSILYRKYKKALRYKDLGAQKRIQAEMRKMNIKRKDLKKSLESTDPLFGLNNSDKKEFIYHYLSDRDRQVYLPRAKKYYKDTFLQRQSQE